MEFRKMVTITLYAKQKKRQMYRTDFWTLWEKARVGYFERTASKHVYYQVWNRSSAQVGWMRQVLGPGALGRPRGIGWRGRWEGGSGWGIHVIPWLILVNVWHKPLKNCKVISLQLIKMEKKPKTCMYKYLFEVMLSILWHKYAEVDLLGPIIDYFILKILYLISWVTLYFFFRMTVPFYWCRSRLGFQFLYILTNFCYFVFLCVSISQQSFSLWSGVTYFKVVGLAGPRCWKERDLWISFLFTYFPSEALANLNSSRQEAEVKKLEENR